MKIALSSDWWRHLTIGITGAAATGIVAYLSHVDWTNFGPYAGLIQLGVQLLAEGVNQVIAMEKA